MERDYITDKDLVDAAIEISHILRAAKVEVALRPKVLGAIVLAMSDGNIATISDMSLARINALVVQTLQQAIDMREEVRNQLINALFLSPADFSRLSPYIEKIIAILRRLSISSSTGADFLGLFYEAFLRYGHDNNALGIVFTPRHITRMCVHLTGVEPGDRVIDIACGTGGFLVAALEDMLKKAPDDAAIAHIKTSFSGFDTNPTVWALAMLNMLFRGNAKSHILNADCFDDTYFASVEGKYTRAYLNPPFSQRGEPEWRFIERAMQALEPEGMLTAIVKAGLFADDEHKYWRQHFLSQHSLLAVISLPEDVFYPTAAPTSILITRAHVPQTDDAQVFLGRVWYDGFDKLKGRRIARGTNQIPEIVEAYHAFLAGEPVTSLLTMIVKGTQLQGGIEWSPQEWLIQPPTMTERETSRLQTSVIRSIFQAVNVIPELATSVLRNFAENWSLLPPLPYGTEDLLENFFIIMSGKSDGERNYVEGEYPYISSSELNNSIIRLVDADPQELFPDGGLTVTAFGQARVQPWAFVARGNGGSSVRVLLPRYSMSVREILWFAAQINSQHWRFFYARMAIKGRLARLRVKAPAHAMPDTGPTLAQRALFYQKTLDDLSRM
ncbi:MAG TPA: N-6 DNA methylase [Ktedonobacteraceae bacterium]|nr:N-6 DNA methylase [Ktedonobacteraceae bacterium]